MVLESNSHKTKMENKALIDKPKTQKIVTGQAKLKKKGFFDFFVSEDASSVKSYLLSDVLVPNIKRLIQELVTSGINQLLYGNDYKPAKSSNNTSRVSYNSFSSSPATQPYRRRKDLTRVSVIPYGRKFIIRMPRFIAL